MSLCRRPPCDRAAIQQWETVLIWIILPGIFWDSADASLVFFLFRWCLCQSNDLPWPAVFRPKIISWNFSCFRLNIIHSVITFVLVTIWTMLLLWEKILTNRQIVLRCPELKLLRLYCSNCLFKLVIVSRNFTSSAQLCATRKWSRSRQARTCVLLGYTYSYMCVCDQRTVIIKDQKDI